jgi:hypothetical protein
VNLQRPPKKAEEIISPESSALFGGGFFHPVRTRFAMRALEDLAAKCAFIAFTHDAFSRLIFTTSAILPSIRATMRARSNADCDDRLGGD